MMGVRMPNSALTSSIDDMRTIPRHKIIEPMPGRKGEVVRIGVGFIWQRNGGKIGRSECMDFRHHLKHRKSCETLLTPLRRVRVTVGNFLRGHGRHKGVTLRSDTLPPLMCDLPVCCDEQVTTWSGGSVANDTGFKIYRGFHTNASDCKSLTLQCSGPPPVAAGTTGYASCFTCQQQVLPSS